ncbi:hypothetical protein [Williamsia deligens]|uniref:SAF domain-containing protein n=1 Tax=Williamsia deligens TaxID=321325 RepID=A0ABW3G8V4_9NOCA|nr:hypothetical protein [Williamsia deligens]MCP2195889.1 hypothetical protein [Williamsia deligens]
MRGDVARAARTGAVVVVTVLVVTAGLYWLGATHPPRRSVVGTDRLGPDSGQSVQDYRASASRGLAAAIGTRWALVTLGTPLDDSAARSLVAGTTPARVALHVPIDGVATPTAVVPVTPDARSSQTARVLAVALLDGAASPGGGTGGIVAQDGRRGDEVASVVTTRLLGGCACVVGVVVRGPADRLRAIATDRRVRVVQVLPADAAGGLVTVVPLLPGQGAGGEPLADDGAVPAR